MPLVIYNIFMWGVAVFFIGIVVILFSALIIAVKRQERCFMEGHDAAMDGKPKFTHYQWGSDDWCAWTRGYDVGLLHKMVELK